MIFTFEIQYFLQNFSILCTGIQSPGPLWTFAQDVPSQLLQQEKKGTNLVANVLFRLSLQVISQGNSRDYFFHSSKITAQSKNGEHFSEKKKKNLFFQHNWSTFQIMWDLKVKTEYVAIPGRIKEKETGIPLGDTPTEELNQKLSLILLSGSRLPAEQEHILFTGVISRNYTLVISSCLPVCKVPICSLSGSLRLFRSIVVEMCLKY